VFGLGCDPDNEQAIQRLLELKQRPGHKGLIIIAADYSQLLNYIRDDLIDANMRQRLEETWPGPVTWLIPVKGTVSGLLTGEHDTLAVRVTAHPVARQLCEQFGKPIVSTSANIAGHEPARSIKELNQQFNKGLSCAVNGDVDQTAKPSEIRELLTNRIIRKSE
jgi:L-threonylcarbamoyladenylate synthase